MQYQAGCTPGVAEPHQANYGSSILRISPSNCRREVSIQEVSGLPLQEEHVALCMLNRILTVYCCLAGPLQ